MSTQLRLLRIDASARREGSVSRQLTDQIIAHFKDAKVVIRDVATALPLIDANWVGANFTPANDRTATQIDTLGLSDRLVAELQAADVIVIGTPVYNFSVPSTLKAWIDQIARAGVTFKYTENGPVGLLTGKRAIVAIASGGTEIGSDIDFAGRYLEHMLGFVGITDVTFVNADQLGAGAKEKLEAATTKINAIAA